MKKLLAFVFLLSCFSIYPSPISADRDRACPGGCPPGQVCQHMGQDPGNPANWRCVNSSTAPKTKSFNPTCKEDTGIKTALGCIPTDPQKFTQAFFKWALPLAGLVAFILIVFGAFSHITSAGNPEAQQKAKEMIGSAITGLIVIIFSVVILQIIGVEILQLPGLPSS